MGTTDNGVRQGWSDEDGAFLKVKSTPRQEIEQSRDTATCQQMCEREVSMTRVNVLFFICVFFLIDCVINPPSHSGLLCKAIRDVCFFKHDDQKTTKEVVL